MQHGSHLMMMMIDDDDDAALSMTFSAWVEVLGSQKLGQTYREKTLLVQKLHVPSPHPSWTVVDLGDFELVRSVAACSMDFQHEARCETTRGTLQDQSRRNCANSLEWNNMFVTCIEHTGVPVQ